MEPERFRVLENELRASPTLFWSAVLSESIESVVYLTEISVVRSIRVALSTANGLVGVGGTATERRELFNDDIFRLFCLKMWVPV